MAESAASAARAEGELLRPPAKRSNIWALVWPSALANALYSAVALATLKAIGYMGADAVAANNNAARIFFIFQAIVFGMSTGAVAMVSQAIGNQKAEEAGRVVGLTLALGVVLSGVIGLVFFLIPGALAGLFNTDANTHELTREFIYWSAFFAFAHIGMIIFSSVLRAAGDARTPLWLGGAANVITIALLAVLVNGYGDIIPAYGMAGAVAAQGIGFALISLLLGALWLRGRLVIPGVIRQIWTGRRLRALLRVSAPAVVEGLAFNVGLFVYVWIIAGFGTVANAAYGIGVQVLLVSIMVGVGFQIAASTVVGQSIGARRPHTAYRDGWRCMRLAIYCMSAFTFVLVVFAEEIALFMIDDKAVAADAVVFVRMLGISQPLMAIEFTLSGALRGAGDTRSPFVITSVGLTSRLLCAGLAVWLDLHVYWLYAAVIFDYGIKSTLFIIQYRSGRWARDSRLRAWRAGYMG